MNMTFQSFLSNGQSCFYFGESLENILRILKKSNLYEIDSDGGSYALYFCGIDLLFDANKLCLIQYEISRVIQMYIGIHKITDKTNIYSFKSYLSEINIEFSEVISDEQIILITEKDVKVYFNSSDGLFVTAMKKCWLNNRGNSPEEFPEK